MNDIRILKDEDYEEVEAEEIDSEEIGIDPYFIQKQIIRKCIYNLNWRDWLYLFAPGAPPIKKDK